MFRTAVSQCAAARPHACSPAAKWWPAAVFVCLLLLSYGTGLCRAAVSPPQVRALEALYGALGGPTWTSYVYANWMHGDPCLDAWGGVFCETIAADTVTCVRLLCGGETRGRQWVWLSLEDELA